MTPDCPVMNEWRSVGDGDTSRSNCSVKRQKKQLLWGEGNWLTTDNKGSGFHAGSFGRRRARRDGIRESSGRRSRTQLGWWSFDDNDKRRRPDCALAVIRQTQLFLAKGIEFTRDWRVEELAECFLHTGPFWVFGLLTWQLLSKGSTT